MQRIQRKRTIQKVYHDFVECAKIGAVKIVHGNVHSLNPQDALEQQIFIYNNIFFSFSIDSPIDFSNNHPFYLAFLGDTINDTVPTHSAVNGDLRGIQKLE